MVITALVARVVVAEPPPESWTLSVWLPPDNAGTVKEAPLNPPFASTAALPGTLTSSIKNEADEDAEKPVPLTETWAPTAAAAGVTVIFGLTLKPYDWE